MRRFVPLILLLAGCPQFEHVQVLLSGDTAVIVLEGMHDEASDLCLQDPNALIRLAEQWARLGRVRASVIADKEGAIITLRGVEHGLMGLDLSGDEPRMPTPWFVPASMGLGPTLMAKDGMLMDVRSAATGVRCDTIPKVALPTDRDVAAPDLPEAVTQVSPGIVVAARDGAVLFAEREAVPAFSHLLVPHHPPASGVPHPVVAKVERGTVVAWSLPVRRVVQGFQSGSPSDLTNSGDPEAGRVLYAQNCAACHGARGEGGIGPSLFDDVTVHGGTAAELRAVISDGVPAKGMPAWGPILGPKKVDHLVAFILRGQPPAP